MHWKSSSQLVICIWWKIALVILILVKQFFLFLNDLLVLFIFWEFWFHAHQLNNLPFCSVAIFSKITLSFGRIPVPVDRLAFVVAFEERLLSLKAILIRLFSPFLLNSRKIHKSNNYDSAPGAQARLYASSAQSRVTRWNVECNNIKENKTRRIEW